MSGKQLAVPSPVAIVRADRRRLAAEEGARAIAAIESQAIEVRQNMARLRELREAKQVADAALAPPLPPTAPKRRTRKSPR